MLWLLLKVNRMLQQSDSAFLVGARAKLRACIVTWDLWDPTASVHTPLWIKNFGK
jgi:hypothetical protein